MPETTNRFDHVKVYRPRGTRYGTGRHGEIERAVELAEEAFIREFGYAPRQEEVVIEIVGVTADWVVTYFEVKE